MYQFEIAGKYNYSNQCCHKLKKELLHKWQKENKKTMTITGMKNEEGGNRANLTCITNKGKMFHPLIVVSEEWENELIERERESMRVVFKSIQFQKNWLQRLSICTNYTRAIRYNVY